MTRDEILQKRRELDAAEIRAEDLYQRRIKIIFWKRVDLQKLCDHPEKDQTFYDDPAGGNDSFHECSLCGKKH